jgi:endoglucanase
VAFTSEATNFDPADNSPDSDVYVKTLGSPTPPFTVSVGDRSLMEGDSGTRNAMFTVRLSKASPTRVTVDFATAAGTATAGRDFTASSGKVTFAPGQTVKNIAVKVVGDRVVEPGESFRLNLSNPVGATIADNQGAGKISNDD